jgi:hypothetical protein
LAGERRRPQDDDVVGPLQKHLHLTLA